MFKKSTYSKNGNLSNKAVLDDVSKSMLLLTIHISSWVSVVPENVSCNLDIEVPQIKMKLSLNPGAPTPSSKQSSTYPNEPLPPYLNY